MNTTGYYIPNTDGRAIACIILEVARPGRFFLSVQEEANKEHYIVRGYPIPGTRHHGEYVINLKGVKAVGSEVRDDTITWREHLLRSRHRIQNLSAIGFVGAGNLTMNPEFIGFSQGVVYYAGIQSFQRRFPCLLSSQQGVVFSHVPCSPTQPVNSDGISGPHLVRSGQSVSFNDLAHMASEGKFYDLRHVIQFPSIDWGEHGFLGMKPMPRIDIGLEHFWNEGELDGNAVAQAMRGNRIEFDVEPYVSEFPPAGEAIGLDRLCSAMTMNGYVESDQPGAPGEWKVASDRIEVCFYQGIYNHSVLGTAENGNLVWLGLTSRGGKEGMTLLDTARLAANHMTDAILIDNGGDVMCRLANNWIAASIHGRERIRAILMLTGHHNLATYETYRFEARPISQLRAPE